MITNHAEPSDRIPDAPLTDATQVDETCSGAVRILLAEDETLVAVLLEEDLRSAGYAIVGPFARLAKAIQASRRETFDLAILDVNLQGEMIFPLAEELRARGIPFLLLSGYGPTSLPEQFRRAPRIPKPYDPDVLIKVIQGIVRKARAAVEPA